MREVVGHGRLQTVTERAQDGLADAGSLGIVGVPALLRTVARNSVYVMRRSPVPLRAAG